MEHTEFLNWFEKSVVRDRNGSPMRVFHGTTHSFNAFSPETMGQATAAPSTRLGFFFTDQPGQGGRTAGRYGAEVWAGDELGSYRPGANIVPAYLRLESPYQAQGLEMWQAHYDSGAGKLRSRLINQGFDGIVYEEPEETWYIAFYPEQIQFALSVEIQAPRPLDAPALGSRRPRLALR